MHAQAKAWRRHPDDQSLHEFRNSLRRCRRLLRVFRDEVRMHGGRSLRQVLTRAADRLGVVRDIDVMLSVIYGSSFHRSGRNEVDVARLVVLLNRRRLTGMKAVDRLAGEVAWERIQAISRRFLDHLERDRKAAGQQSIKDFFNHEYERCCRRIVRSNDMAQTANAKILHAFRVRLRRLRYLGLMLKSLAGNKQAKMFERVHACEKILGRIHDIDITLMFLTAPPNRAPLMLRAELESLRDRNIQHFRSKWVKCGQKLEAAVRGSK